MRAESPTTTYRRHGLKGDTKRLVFDALFQQQDGRCFICGISQAEIDARVRESEARKALLRVTYPQATFREVAPVHRTLHIDHCHETGAIRGLLCEHCNYKMAWAENYGFRCPGDMEEDYFTRVCEHTWRWVVQHQERVILYMQPERWLPRKDILFHLRKISALQ